MSLTAADRCHICGHPINGKCRHPWAKPFCEWPGALLRELKSILRPDRHPGS